MEDDRIWTAEEGLWRASSEKYREQVDPECIMVLRRAPHVFAGQAAVDAVRGTPEWDEVTFSDRKVSRPEEGLIVVGYRVEATQGDTRFAAACTSVYRRRAHEDWTVVQHAQLPLD